MDASARGPGRTRANTAVLSAAKTDLQPAQPENVFVMDSLNLFKEERGVSAMLACHKAWSAKRATVAAETTLPVPSDLAKLSRSYMVLVVDDSVQNLSLAAMVLPGQKIAVAQNLADALRLLSLGGDKFDAVLTDLNMPPDKAYPALNLERYGVTDTVPAGIADLLLAAPQTWAIDAGDGGGLGVLGLDAGGAQDPCGPTTPVLFVDLPEGFVVGTDANHHQDFFSAMFDCVKGAEVNGQKVLFRGDSGKRWDRALQALLEPDAPGE